MLTSRSLWSVKLYLAIVACSQCWPAVEAYSYLQNNYPPSVLEDASLDMEGLTAKYRYPLETHYIITEDGYILCIHRLPRPEARPVFLMHGVLDSSLTWILPGPWAGLGYLLFDQGYDVWMGNVRGNYYSRNHTSFDPDTDTRFWSFSFHEIGYYDLPAMIDYILDRTFYNKLAYFGHSQGTTTFFVLMSQRPAYNEKISIMSALAPVVFMGRIKVPECLKVFIRTYIFAGMYYMNELLPRSKNGIEVCLSSKNAENLCLYNLYALMGEDVDMFNRTMTPVFFSHEPNGCNIKQVHHFLQLISSHRFCQYDYGVVQNMQIYKSVTPSEYPLQRVTAPIALYYTYNDNLAHELDVQQLAHMLPNVVENCLFPYRHWNHMALVWGINARKLAHRRIIDIMRRHEFSSIKRSHLSPNLNYPRSNNIEKGNLEPYRNQTQSIYIDSSSSNSIWNSLRSFAQTVFKI